MIAKLLFFAQAFQVGKYIAKHPDHSAFLGFLTKAATSRATAVRPSKKGDVPVPVAFSVLAMLERPIETGGFPCMAGRACRIYYGKQGVGITIVTKFNQLLGIARFFALMPEFLTATRPEPGCTLADGAAHRFFIHPCHHQHFTCLLILDDARDKPIGVLGKILDLQRGGFTFIHGGPFIVRSSAHACFYHLQEWHNRITKAQKCKRVP